MELSGSSGKGLLPDVDFICQTDSNSYPTIDKVRNLNNSYHDVTRLIWSCSGDWEYDDSNKSDLPISTATLVGGQQDYELPTTAQRIERVEVLDINNNYQLLKPIDMHDVNVALDEFKETDGMPQYYDMVGDSIFLYPAPSAGDVVSAKGLKIHYNRDITEFSASPVSAFATTVPGFATQFHRILSYSAALDFEEDASKRANLVRRKDALEKGLKSFYGKRHRVYRTRIKPKSYRYQRIYE